MSGGKAAEENTEDEWNAAVESAAGGKHGRYYFHLEFVYSVTTEDQTLQSTTMSEESIVFFSDNPCILGARIGGRTVYARLRALGLANLIKRKRATATVVNASAICDFQQMVDTVAQPISSD